MNVKFSNLQLFNSKYNNKFLENFNSVIESGWYINGNFKSEFETEFAHYLDASYCIGVGNGLDALVIILEGYKALGMLSDGDHVIIPSNTFIATALAVSRCNLIPVLVPPSLESYNIDFKLLSNYITPKCKAIIPVHLYGRAVDFDAIKYFSQKFNLLVIEDAAQAHGAKSSGYKCGNLGDAAAFSFYPGKNLGALGDAGAIVTNDKDLANVCRSISNYGSLERYNHEYIGVNSRLDELQAAFLLTKLRDLDEVNNIRIKMAEFYNNNIKSPYVKLPLFTNDVDHFCNVWHQYVVFSKVKGRLVSHLQKNGIEIIVHYPTSVFNYKCYKNQSIISSELNHDVVTHHDYIFSLPMCPTLTKQQLEYVVDIINRFDCNESI